MSRSCENFDTEGADSLPHAMDMCLTKWEKKKLG